MTDKPSNADREDILLLARLAQQTERYVEMVGFVKHFFQRDSDVSPQAEVEERNIISAAYKNLVGNKRAELRVLTAIEQKEQKRSNNNNDNPNLKYIREYKLKIEGELAALCSEILNTIHIQLIPSTSTIDSKVFYLKMKGDYNRYLAEFQLDEAYNTAVKEAKYAYEEAEKICKINLDATNPIRLGLLLNMSVFYYEILSDTERAKEIAKRAFDEAISNIDSVSQDQYKDCTLIMQLIRDNLTLWSSEVPMDNNDD